MGRRGARRFGWGITGLIRVRRRVFAMGFSNFRPWPELALGHSRRSKGASRTSGLPRRTDILGVRRQVSKVPSADLP